MTLANKYRPQDLNDVCEQDSIKQLLQKQTNAPVSGYLMCGEAGVGKTTIARIFAKMLNAEVIELDAASYSGVDNVKTLCTQAKIRSATHERKVFIVDEAHAISSSGWQAFLKTLEEPLEFSTFIFCTTVPAKVPRTILSRVQRLDFAPITKEGIIRRLHDVSEKEGIDIDMMALKQIAENANGCMRQALAWLEQCTATCERITIDTVKKLFGVENNFLMNSLTHAVEEKKGNDIMNILLTTKYHFPEQYLDYLISEAKLSLSKQSSEFNINTLVVLIDTIVDIMDSNYYKDYNSAYIMAKFLLCLEKIK